MQQRLSDYTDQRRRAGARDDFLKFAFAQAKFPIGPGGQRDTYQLSAFLKSLRSVPIDGWIEKAAVGGSTVGNSDGFSDLSSIAREWLAQTQEQTVLGKIDARRIPFGCRVNMATAPDGRFAGAGSAIYPAQVSSDAGTFLRRTTVGTIAVVTSELLSVWAPGTREALDAILTRSLVRGMDAALLDVDSAGVTGEQPASVLYGLSPLGALASTVAGVLTQIKQMIQVPINGGSDVDRALFIMHPTTALDLSTLITAEGSFAFPQLTPTGGFILGVPVAVTVSAQRSGSPTQKIFALVDGGQIALADDNEIGLSTSRLAVLHQDDASTMSAADGTGTSTTSLFQTDSVAIKLTRAVAWERLTDNACAWMTA